MAMAISLGLGIPQDKLQELIMTIMTNPDLIKRESEKRPYGLFLSLALTIVLIKTNGLNHLMPQHGMLQP